MRNTLLLISVYLLVCSIERFDSKLIAVQVLTRHGDRNIIFQCPSDPWKDEKYWPGGYEELTNKGKQQLYELGKWLKKRYQNLLPNGYAADNTYVVSSETDRTMMSAASNLAGLFPPKPNQVWNENLLWQPIPIHVIPEKMDTMLSGSAECPAFNTLFGMYSSSDKMKKVNDKYKYLYPMMEKFCGKPVHSLADAVQIFDILLVETDHHKSTPDWVPKKLNEMQEMAASFYQSMTGTPQLARLRGGYFVKNLLDIFIAKSMSILSPDRSLFIYSASDITIINVLNSLKLFDNDMPPYASSVLFELHETNGTHTLKIFYKKTDEADLLDVPNCGKSCPLDKFQIIYNDIIPTKSYSEECHTNE